MDNYPDIDATRFPLSRIVLDYSDLHEKLVQDYKKPGFDKLAWRGLEQFVETFGFEPWAPSRRRSTGKSICRC